MTSSLNSIGLLTLCTLLLVVCSVTYGDFSKDVKKKVREAVVSGMFYPGTKGTLTNKVRYLLKNAPKEDIKNNIIALIAPHAGYDYSGPVAACSFNLLEGRHYDTVILIGPSHHVAFNGISVYNEGYYETPLGLVKINSEAANNFIASSKKIFFYPPAHLHEHALEVELPFLQTVLKEFEIVPIIIGTHSLEGAELLSGLLMDIIKKKDVLIVISVDLSHYHPYREAVKLDTDALDTIETKDTKLFFKKYSSGELEIDAPGAIMTFMLLAEKLNGDIKVVKYANSGDITGDKSRVVGYSSVVLTANRANATANPNSKSADETELNEEEKTSLLKMARTTITQYLKRGKRPIFEISNPKLFTRSGAFVTIHKHGSLRGCIGYIEAIKPLYQTVNEVAVSAAVNDPRFPPLREEELKDIDLEISVLTPLKRIEEIDEIQVGRHGIVIRQGFNSGLLLPQVATEYGWDRLTFLSHTCQKAGLPLDAWQDKNTQIYIFSAQVFGEKETQIQD